MDNYIEWLKKNEKSDNTVLVYVNAVKQLIKWYEESEDTLYDPKDITVLHIKEFKIFMDMVEKFSPRTTNKTITALKSYFSYLLESKIISYNPMTKIKTKRYMEDIAPRWLTKQENAKFFHSIDQIKNEKRKSRDFAICRLMGSAGLRVSEVHNLNICDISFIKKREDVIIRNGKGDKFRIVPLNGDVIESLKHWMKFRNAIDENEPLFLGEKNSRISSRTIHRIVSKYANRANLIDVSPHNLRHTFCKNLIDAGVSLDRVAYLAGHDSLETTKRYTKPSKLDLRNAVRSICENEET